MSRSRINMDETLAVNVRREVEHYIEENKYWPHKRTGVARMRKYLDRLDGMSAADAERIIIGDYLSTSEKGPLGDSTEMRDRLGEVIRMRKNIKRNEMLQLALSHKLKLRLLQKSYQESGDPILDPIAQKLFEFKEKLKRELQSESREEKNDEIETDEILAPLWKYFQGLKGNLKEGLVLEQLTENMQLSHEELDKVVEKSLDRFLQRSFNRFIEPAINNSLQACFGKNDHEHQRLLNERYDREFEESVQKEVSNSPALFQDSNQVRRIRLSSYLLVNQHTPSEDHDLPGETFLDTLKGELRRQIRLYQVIDNPVPKNRFFDGKAFGRVRATSYLQEINQISEKDLFVKMLRDYMYYDGRSSLGNSVKLRERIGDAICRYMGITNEVMLRLIREECTLGNPIKDHFYKPTPAFRHDQTCEIILRDLPNLLINNPACFPSIVGEKRMTFGDEIMREVLKKDTAPKLERQWF